MRRRRDGGIGLGGLMVMIAKEQWKVKNGALRIMPYGYIFSDKGFTSLSGKFYPPLTAAGGRMVSFKRGFAVRNCPRPPGDFPVSVDDSGTHWVPLKECRKCQHHIDRVRGRPYRCCEVLHQIAAGEPNPVEKAKEMHAAAVDRAREVLG